MMRYSSYISALERQKENCRKKHLILPTFIYLHAAGSAKHWPEGFWGVGVFQESDLGFTRCVGCETHLNVSFEGFIINKIKSFTGLTEMSNKTHECVLMNR